MTELNKSVLRILLKDRTTRRNIIWATEDYVEYGSKCVHRAAAQYEGEVQENEPD